MITEELKKAINVVQGQKKSFIPPKKAMSTSIENDTQYLLALSNFIQSAQKEMNKHILKKNDYEASKIQLEIFDSISKFQANQGLVNDKMLHYEKVFLPRYEKELEESKQGFFPLLDKIKSALEENNDSQDSLIKYMKEEVDAFESSENKEDDEFHCYTYKIFKRLYSKFEEGVEKKAN